MGLVSVVSHTAYVIGVIANWLFCCGGPSLPPPQITMEKDDSDLKELTSVLKYFGIVFSKAVAGYIESQKLENVFQNGFAWGAGIALGISSVSFSIFGAYLITKLVKFLAKAFFSLLKWKITYILILLGVLYKVSGRFGKWVMLKYILVFVRALCNVLGRFLKCGLLAVVGAFKMMKFASLPMIVFLKIAALYRRINVIRPLRQGLVKLVSLCRRIEVTRRLRNGFDMIVSFYRRIEIVQPLKDGLDKIVTFYKGTEVVHLLRNGFNKIVIIYRRIEIVQTLKDAIEKIVSIYRGTEVARLLGVGFDTIVSFYRRLRILQWLKSGFDQTISFFRESKVTRGVKNGFRKIVSISEGMELTRSLRNGFWTIVNFLKEMKIVHYLSKTYGAVAVRFTELKIKCTRLLKHLEMSLEDLCIGFGYAGPLSSAKMVLLTVSIAVIVQLIIYGLWL